MLNNDEVSYIDSLTESFKIMTEKLIKKIEAFIGDFREWGEYFIFNGTVSLNNLQDLIAKMKGQECFSAGQGYKTPAPWPLPSQARGQATACE